MCLLRVNKHITFLDSELKEIIQLSLKEISVNYFLLVYVFLAEELTNKEKKN